MTKELFFKDVTRVKIQDIVDKKIKLRGCLFDEKEKGEYAIIFANQDGKLISFTTGAKAILKILKAYVQTFSNYEKKKIYAFEAEKELEVTIQKKTNKTQQNYYTME